MRELVDIRHLLGSPHRGSVSTIYNHWLPTEKSRRSWMISRLYLYNIYIYDIWYIYMIYDIYIYNVVYILYIIWIYIYIYILYHTYIYIPLSSFIPYHRIFPTITCSSRTCARFRSRVKKTLGGLKQAGGDPSVVEIARYGTGIGRSEEAEYVLWHIPQ